MASTKEIKDRIESVRQTQKITNAMYLISSTKLRRAREDLAHTRPYFEALQAEIKRIFRTSSDIRSRYFYPPNEDDIKGGPYACLVITADKGLAGAYNQNAVKETMKVLQGHPGCKLFVVGEYGRHYFTQHRIPIEQSFLYTAQNPTLQRAREISAILLDGFNRGQWRKIYIVYTDMASSLAAAAKSTRLLPFHRAHFASADEDHLQRAERPHDRHGRRQRERPAAAGRAQPAVQPGAAVGHHPRDHRGVGGRQGPAP